MHETTGNSNIKTSGEINGLSMKIRRKFIKKLHNLFNFIYNKRTGLILKYRKIELVYLFVFYLIFYGISTGIFVIGINSIFKVTQSISNPVIKRSQTIVPLNGYKLQSDKLCGDQTILANTLFAYLNSYSQATQPYCNALSTSKCSFQASSLGSCGTLAGIQGILASNRYCVYLRLSKIVDYKPKGKQNVNLADVRCRQIDDTTQLTTTPTHFFLAAYPNELNANLDPLVALVVPKPSNSIVKFTCSTELLDLSPSASSQPNQAILSTEFTLDTTKC